MVEIVFAKKSDGDGILSFLDAHWQTGHVFTKDPGLFSWQHGLPGTDELSFVLGREEGGGEILGILGYVPVSRYDPACTTGDFTLATWKVRDDCNVNGLGLFLFKALTKRMKPDFVGVAGLSEMVVPIYRALRFETGQMSQHVFFNRTLKDSTLACGVSSTAMPDFFDAGTQFRNVNKLSAISAGVAAEIETIVDLSQPKRRLAYILGRYGDHPVYHYALSLIEGGACFVWRKISTERGNCLRVVDYFGDATALASTGAALQSLLESEEADYIDIVHTGLDTNALTSAGFVERRDVEGLVVPHYFEPFEQRNVDLDYAMRVFDKSDTTPPVLLRGFTDQDRPNQVHALNAGPHV